MCINMLTAARIGFLNTTLLVNEISGFATLYVAILGSTTLGREVAIRFSTADSSATGNDSHYYYSLGLWQNLTISSQLVLTTQAQKSFSTSADPLHTMLYKCQLFKKAYLSQQKCFMHI